jgi:phosphoglycolate phosphatase
MSIFGMPDHQIFEYLMPDSTLSQRILARQFRDQYISEYMKNENILLPDAFEVLSTLKDRGYCLTTASNCGTQYLNDILDTQNIRSFFTSPLCLGSIEGKVKSDILDVHFTYFSKKGAYMVGDRSSDVEAGRAHGIPVIGCAFGFGPEYEIEDADIKIKSLQDLLTIFKSSDEEIYQTIHIISKTKDRTHK